MLKISSRSALRSEPNDPVAPFARRSRYAGDEAWTEWFAICSVAGCSEANARRLREQVASAMYAQLARAGLSRDEAGADDPVAFFDSYFALKGTRVGKKPLKSYFAYRIAAEGIPLADFACGTLFGSLSGRVRDIVEEWVAVLKGWKPRTLTGSDGSRHRGWERTGENGPGPDGTDALDRLQDARDPAGFLDRVPLERAADGCLARIAERIRVEKRAVALLLIVTAYDVSVTEPVVLAALGVAKSKAYQLRERVARELEREAAHVEGGDDPQFVRALLEVCETELPPETRKGLGLDA